MAKKTPLGPYGTPAQREIIKNDQKPIITPGAIAFVASMGAVISGQALGCLGDTNDGMEPVENVATAESPIVAPFTIPGATYASPFPVPGDGVNYGHKVYYSSNENNPGNFDAHVARMMGGTVVDGPYDVLTSGANETLLTPCLFPDGCTNGDRILLARNDQVAAGVLTEGNIGQTDSITSVKILGPNVNSFGVISRPVDIHDGRIYVATDKQNNGKVRLGYFTVDAINNFDFNGAGAPNPTLTFLTFPDLDPNSEQVDITFDGGLAKVTVRMNGDNEIVNCDNIDFQNGTISNCIPDPEFTDSLNSHAYVTRWVDGTRYNIKKDNAGATAEIEITNNATGSGGAGGGAGAGGNGQGGQGAEGGAGGSGGAGGNAEGGAGGSGGSGGMAGAPSDGGSGGAGGDAGGSPEGGAGGVAGAGGSGGINTGGNGQGGSGPGGAGGSPETEPCDAFVSDQGTALDDQKNLIVDPNETEACASECLPDGVLRTVIAANSGCVFTLPPESGTGDPSSEMVFADGQIAEVLIDRGSDGKFRIAGDEDATIMKAVSYNHGIGVVIRYTPYYGSFSGFAGTKQVVEDDFITVNGQPVKVLHHSVTEGLTNVYQPVPNNGLNLPDSIDYGPNETGFDFNREGEDYVPGQMPAETQVFLDYQTGEVLHTEDNRPPEATTTSSSTGNNVLPEVPEGGCNCTTVISDTRNQFSNLSGLGTLALLAGVAAARRRGKQQGSEDKNA